MKTLQIILSGNLFCVATHNAQHPERDSFRRNCRKSFVSKVFGSRSKQKNSLKYLNLSSNQIQLTLSDYKSLDFFSLFAEKLNLSHIDLSYNRLLFLNLYFTQNHTKIDKFDFYV